VKGLSVVITVFLLVVAAALPNYLKKADALPKETSGLSHQGNGASALAQQRSSGPATSAHPFRN